MVRNSILGIIQKSPGLITISDQTARIALICMNYKDLSAVKSCNKVGIPRRVTMLADTKHDVLW